jgi:hypothetical protein
MDTSMYPINLVTDIVEIVHGRLSPTLVGKLEFSAISIHNKALFS